MQDLDRNWSVENGVPALPHPSHPSGGDWADELVAPPNPVTHRRGGEVLWWVGGGHNDSVVSASLSSEATSLDVALAGCFLRARVREIDRSHQTIKKTSAVPERA